MFNAFKILLQKELIEEKRKPINIAASLLYLCSAFIICWLLFNHATNNLAVWNIFFWILLLFSATNSIAKSFATETEETFYYLFCLTNSYIYFLAKVGFHWLLTLFQAIVLLILSYFFNLKVPVNWVVYFVFLLLASLGMSILLCFSNFLAKKTNNNFTIASLIGFPLLLPFLFIVYHFETTFLNGISNHFSLLQLFIILCVFDLGVLLITSLLITFVWRT